MNKINHFKSGILRVAVMLTLAVMTFPIEAWAQKSITVAGITITDPGDNYTHDIQGENISGIVTIDFYNKTLTLIDATINGDIEWNAGANDFPEIDLQGKNTVNGNIISTYGVDYPESPQLLYLVRRSDAESATLKYTGSIDGFNPAPENDFKTRILNTVGDVTYKYYTTLDVYDLKVAAIQVHDIEGEPGYKGNIFQDEGTPTVTFDGTNTLTLNGATLTKQVDWSIDADLTVELKGTNSITTDGACITTTKNTQAISFTRGDASNPCSLSLINEKGGAAVVDVIRGFANSKTPQWEQACIGSLLMALLATISFRPPLHRHCSVVAKARRGRLT